MNNKGQGMSTNTIVILILAVIVLVVLILGFTMGWSKLAPWISSTNVDNIVNSCSAACSTGGIYEFCSVDRELKDADKNKITTTCAVLSEVEEYLKYGIATCSVDCKKPCEEIKIDGTKASLSSSMDEEKIDLTSLASDADGVNSFCLF